MDLFRQSIASNLISKSSSESKPFLSFLNLFVVACAVLQNSAQSSRAGQVVVLPRRYARPGRQTQRGSGQLDQLGAVDCGAFPAATEIVNFNDKTKNRMEKSSDRMRGYNQETVTDAAFAHLEEIHTLNVKGCNQRTVTAAAFPPLAGISNLIWN
jgi:hypothetical protein